MNQFDFICFQPTSHSKVTIWRPTEERTPTSAKIHIDEMKCIDKMSLHCPKTLLIFPSAYFLREYLQKKNVLFWASREFPLPTPSPQFGQLVQLFSTSKKVDLSSTKTMKLQSQVKSYKK